MIFTFCPYTAPVVHLFRHSLACSSDAIPCYVCACVKLCVINGCCWKLRTIKWLPKWSYQSKVPLKPPNTQFHKYFSLSTARDLNNPAIMTLFLPYTLLTGMHRPSLHRGLKDFWNDSQHFPIHPINARKPSHLLLETFNWLKVLICAFPGVICSKKIDHNSLIVEPKIAPI